jgi:hypothetical protein
MQNSLGSFHVQETVMRVKKSTRIVASLRGGPGQEGLAASSAGAGRYLERPQRWGVLPTMAFWCRRDVSTSARLMVIPVWMLTAHLMLKIAVKVAWWSVPLMVAGALTVMFLLQGLLERYIRLRAPRMTAQQRLELMTAAGEHDDDVVVTPRRTLVLIFAMVFGATGLLSWSVWWADARRDARAQVRQEQDERIKVLEEQFRLREKQLKAFPVRQK